MATLKMMRKRRSNIFLQKSFSKRFNDKL